MEADKNPFAIIAIFTTCTWKHWHVIEKSNNLGVTRQYTSL